MVNKGLSRKQGRLFCCKKMKHGEAFLKRSKKEHARGSTVFSKPAE